MGASESVVICNNFRSLWPVCDRCAVTAFFHDPFDWANRRLVEAVRPPTNYHLGMVDQAIRKRWLPAFSVRTLLIVTTLLCAYGACWGPTKTRGVADVQRKTGGVGPHPFAPLIVSTDYLQVVELAPGEPLLYPGYGPVKYLRCRQYYFWFFGLMVKLPYERSAPASPEAITRAT